MFLRRLLLVSAFVCLSFPNYMFASFIQASPINGFSPSTICSGSNTAVIVTGYGFTNVIAVKIGMNNVSYNIINDSTLEISNTSGASTDYIFLETSTATMKSPNQLSIIELTPIINGNLSGVVCGGTDITYTAAGGSFYEFFVDGISFGVPSPNNSITFKPAHGQNIYVKAYDASMNCAAFSNVITAQIETVSIPQLISSATNVTVCNNEPLSTSIIYSLTNGANDAFVTGLPPGISAEISGSNIIISGTPNVASAQDYNYVITPSGMPCVSSAYGTISIALDTSLEKTPSSGGVSQILCEGNSLDPIEYIVGGGGDNAVVSGLPNGVTSNYDTTAGVLSIQGTPSDNISIENTYNYAVTTSGSGCNEKILRGSITVQPLAELSLLAGSGALDQVLCEGVAVVPVLIALEGGTDIVSISGLPNGVNYTIDGATKVVTISGTPLENIAIFEVFSFVVSSISERCTETTLQGAIRVNGDSNLEHLISSGDTSQTLCEESALKPIEFSVVGGASNATVTGLPNGVVFNFDATAGVLSIEGIPSDDIAIETQHSYTLTTSGSGCSETIFRGSITVQPLPELSILSSSGALNQEVCEGDAITPILIALEGGTDIVSISGLPNGINYTIDSAIKVLTISGNPAETVNAFEMFSFVISSISTSCIETTLQGSIRLNGDSRLTHVFSSGDTSQTLCEGMAVTPISFTVDGGATNAIVSGLPSGMIFDFDAAAGILSIEGTPTDNITLENTYNYTISTTGGGCNQQIFRGTISIQPKAELKLLASSGTLNQVLCEGEAITPILIALEGGTDFSSITGLPSGVNYSFDNVTKILSVSGTPAADISSIEQALISFATTTSCNTSFLTGVLTINQQSSVELISHLQTQNQLVCGVTPIEKIEYQLRDGATNASVSGLPAGVTWSLSTNIIEIVGVPENVVYETAYDYTIIADGNGCASSITSSIVVTPNTMDMPIAEEQQYFCVYNTPTLTDIVVYANNLKWYSADGLVELDPGTLLVDGETYYAHNEVIISEASAIDRYACRSFATPIEVFISDTPAPQILELTNNFCSDGFYTLSDIKTNVDQVIWYNSLISDTPLSQETPLETNSYYAAAINPKTGCESTTRTNFEVVVNPCTVVVYNALSINGDGLNEKLIIENIEYFTENELMIYNRNGRIVFKTTNYGANNNFFRGYSNMNSTLGKNKVLPMGTYFYTFSFVRPSDRKLMTEKGFINLVAN